MNGFVKIYVLADHVCVADNPKAIFVSHSTQAGFVLQALNKRCATDSHRQSSYRWPVPSVIDVSLTTQAIFVPLTCAIGHRCVTDNTGNLCTADLCHRSSMCHWQHRQSLYRWPVPSVIDVSLTTHWPSLRYSREINTKVNVVSPTSHRPSLCHSRAILRPTLCHWQYTSLRCVNDNTQAAIVLLTVHEPPLCYWQYANHCATMRGGGGGTLGHQQYIGHRCSVTDGQYTCRFVSLAQTEVNQLSTCGAVTSGIYFKGNECEADETNRDWPLDTRVI